MQYRLSLINLAGYPPLSISFKGTNGYQLPFEISSEARDTIKPLLSERIPATIQLEIAHLLQLERDCVQQRKQLLTDYRKQFNDDIQPFLASLPESHPELFI